LFTVVTLFGIIFINVINSGRKIFSINESSVLIKFTASRIRNLAMKSGIEISIEKNKIVMPKDKKDIKNLLCFLDEGAYKGPFSLSTYITNSKKKI
jgi:hypothetical protein